MLHLSVPRTQLNCYSKKRRTSLVLISGHQAAQTLIQWIIRSGVLRSRECTNVVWTVSMSWNSASLKSGTVCIRTLLTRPSTSGESNWERACVQMDNILNILLWARVIAKVMDVALFFFSRKRYSFTAELVLFRVLKFPKVRYVQ